MKFVIIDTETTHVDINSAQVLELGLIAIDTEQFKTYKDVVLYAPKLSILVYHQSISNASIDALAFNSELIKYISTKTSEKLPNVFIESKYNKLEAFVTNRNDDYSFIELVAKNTEVALLVGRWLAKSKCMVPAGEYTYENAKKSTLDNPLNFRFYFKRITYAGKNIQSFDLPILNNNFNWSKYFPPKHRFIDPSVIFSSPDMDDIPTLEQCFKQVDIPQTTIHRAIPDSLDIAKLLYLHWGLTTKEEILKCDEEIQTLFIDSKKRKGEEK